MADEKKDEVAGEAAGESNEGAERRILINKVYLKDFSFDDEIFF